MKLLTSFRSRLLAINLTLLLIGFGGLSLLAGRQIADGAYADYAVSVQIQTLSLATELHELFEHLPSGPAMDAAVVKEVNAIFPSGVTTVAVYDGQGHLLYSDAEPEVAAELFHAPESLGALQQQVTYRLRANSDGVLEINSAAPVLDDADVLGLVHVARSADAASQVVRQRWLTLAAGFFLLFILGALAAWWLLSTMMRPLSRLRDAALAMAGGNLSLRIGNPGDDEVGEVARAFNDMAGKVESTVAEQRAFASNASHELRTPLTTIRLRTSRLRSTALDPATAQQYIEEIDDEAVRLSGLVEDLILLSRIDANRLEVGDEQIDPDRLTRSVVRGIAPFARSKRVSLEVEPVSTPISAIQANLNHVSVALRNLIDNAVKYTPTGGSVAVQVGEDNGFVRWSVTDTGQGIPQEELGRLTQRFYRTDPSRGRNPNGERNNTKGSGLGLALVESIVGVYGGRLTLQSGGPGRGTTATLLWPIVQADAGNSPIFTQVGGPRPD